MITVYSKPACVQCTAVKRQLKKLNLEYTEVDISQDSEAKSHVESLGYLQVPVVDMGNGETFSGYRPDIIKNAALSVSAM